MSIPAHSIPVEPRWPSALALLAVFCIVEALPHHVYVIPEWVAYGAVAMVLVPMIAVALQPGNDVWRRLERNSILLFAAIYAANTTAELADMIGIITIHPPETRAVSLLSSSLSIWLVNVLTFSFLYWQIDRGGPYQRALATTQKPDWLFPQMASPEVALPNWQPKYVDYLALAFNTATAFSPTDVLPLSRRAKALMMLESVISLLTLVIVAARAVNVLP
ncbi:hypothetical protein IB238_13340 [Rhizobium sp. ARZ01]|uniref:hypothetical protein n=1 Tax=Rhizobium sp. ARZ01 TaxID=2769313 RepID=UPI001785FA7C|nr:hypothetical protein [Rhizobium sp. ARZ01]MBD9373605.1 hypothetical protein [Rhizobium sp. ARZ01]